MNTNRKTITVDKSNPDRKPLSVEISPTITFSYEDAVDLQIPTESVSLSYNQTVQLVETPTINTEVSKEQFYFTPIYTNVIDYEEWKTLDRQFREL